MEPKVDSSKYYVLYDGDCGFCNFWIQWILKRDSKDLFRFSALQSEFSTSFLKERGLEAGEMNTIYLWKPGLYYHTKSSAAIEIAKVLGGTYGLLARINFLPRSLTDTLYDKVAKNRKNLASSYCAVPTEVQRKKFID
ncbi:thiol-disulfide oxidoreductase DCC family protein [Chryseobacterium sp. A301]